MTEIIEHEAQQITVNTEETFEEFKNRLFRKRYPIQYKTGAPIEVQPGTFNSFLKFTLTRAGTPQEFMNLFGAVMAMIKQMENAGQLPENWVVDVATPFDVTPPPIPDRFADEIPEGMEIKTYLDGELCYRLEMVPIPVVEEE
jgi:hypothetical protein